jgi:hypothetical protein
LEISFGSFSPSSSSSALSRRRPTAPRRAPPLWAGRRPTPASPSLHVALPHASGPIPLVLVPPPLATRPRRASRSCHGATSPPPVPCAARPPWRAAPAPPPAPRGFHASRLSSPPLYPSRWCPLLSPRRPEPPAQSHLAGRQREHAAVPNFAFSSAELIPEPFSLLFLPLSA